MFAAGCTPLGAGERALSSAAATGSGRATAQRGRRRCTVPCCVQASSGPRRNQPPPAGAATGGSSAWASVISLAAAAPAGVFEQTPGEAEVVSAAGSPSTTAAKVRIALPGDYYQHAASRSVIRSGRGPRRKQESPC